MATAHAPGWVVSDGTAGRTLDRMRDAVHSCLRSSPVLIQLANEVVAPITPHNTLGQIDAIDDFLSRCFRYINDPLGVELLRDPAFQAESIRERGYVQGDCDEAATLAASLGMANGIPARFRALAFYTKDAPFTHVICDLQGPDKKWYPIDVTKPPGMDHPPTPTRTLTLAV